MFTLVKRCLQGVTVRRGRDRPNREWLVHPGDYAYPSIAVIGLLGAPGQVVPRSKDPPLISQADIGAVVGLEGSIRPNSGAVDQVPRSSPAHLGSRDVPLGPPA